MPPTDAAESLIIAHVALARAIARRFAARRRLPESDVESEAMLALCEAAGSFDAGRGSPFGAHATANIGQHLRRWVARQRKSHSAEVPLEDADGPVAGHGQRSDDAMDGERLAELVRGLGLRDATIIRWHFGIDGTEPRSIRAIARYFSVDESAIRRRVAKLTLILRRRLSRAHE